LGPLDLGDPSLGPPGADRMERAPPRHWNPLEPTIWAGFGGPFGQVSEVLRTLALPACREALETQNPQPRTFWAGFGIHLRKFRNIRVGLVSHLGSFGNSFGQAWEVRLWAGFGGPFGQVSETHLGRFGMSI